MLTRLVDTPKVFLKTLILVLCSKFVYKAILRHVQSEERQQQKIVLVIPVLIPSILCAMLLISLFIFFFIFFFLKAFYDTTIVVTVIPPKSFVRDSETVAGNIV